MRRRWTFAPLVVVALVLLSGLTLAESVEIRWAMYNIGDAFRDRMEEAKEAFEALHPDIRVVIEYSPWADYWEKLLVQHAVGVGPDVTINQTDWVPIGVPLGMFADLTPYIERDQIDLSEYFPVAIDDWTYREGLYGGILYLAGESFMINTQMFDQTGLDYPDEAWDWDVMLEASRKLAVDRDGDGLKDQYALQTHYGTYFSIASFIRENGGDVLNAERNASLLTQPEAVGAIRFIRDLMFDYDVMVSPRVTQRGIRFDRGNVAMNRDGVWVAANLRDVAPFDIDFAPPPKGPSGRRNLQWGSNAWSIMATSEHPDEAWELVKFLMSEPGQIIFSALGLPGLRSVAQSQVFLEPWDGYRYDLVLDGVAGYSHSYYPTEDWNQWTAESAAVLRQVWEGAISPEEGALRAHETIERIFAQRTVD